MIENYDNFEEMFTRALGIATITAKVWGHDYADDFTEIRHDGDYITATGNDHCGDHIDESFPASYMNMSDNKIRDREHLLKAEFDADQDCRRIEAEAIEKEHRRGLYIKLNKEFKNDHFEDE